MGKHYGLSKHYLYATWSAMIDRCTNENTKHYQDYGGRGITVAKAWLPPTHKGFKQFLRDVGERPDGMTLDRIDNDRGYKPSNVRWADKITQRKNQRPRIEVATYDFSIIKEDFNW